MNPLLLALMACSDPPAQRPVDEPEVLAIEPSPWVFESPGTGEPPIDPAVLGQALQRAIVEVLTYDAAPVVDAYVALHAASAEPACPPETVDAYGNTYWADICTASDGTVFGGYLSRYNYVGVYDDDAGVYLDGVTLAGNVVVEDAGGTYDLEGAAGYITGESADGLIKLVQSYVIGGFSHHSAAAVGWLRDAGTGEALSVTLIGYGVPSYDGGLLIVDAALQVEVDGEPYSVVLENLQLGDEIMGSLCTDEPGGTVSIRDPHGRWFDATFHGPDLSYLTTLGDPAKCDGCADLELDGEPVGELCASFEPWYQWEKIR